MIIQNLINELQEGDSTDNIIVASDDSLFSIESVNPVEGAIIIKLVTISDIGEDSHSREIGGDNSSGDDNCNNNGGFDMNNTIDVIGDLNNFELGG